MVFHRDPGETGEHEKEEKGLRRDKPRNAKGGLQSLVRPNHKQMESVLGHRSASQLNGALNSATATLDTNKDSVVFSVAELGSKISEHKTAQQWSSEETSTLLVIWSSTEIQERLGSSKRTKRVHKSLAVPSSPDFLK
ncbi:hypothetical protein QQF64_029167 [Cirrhinus molitorella]|uniref:Uncharacterized protein n=1 Tax=Cirrhinus molitorella TaxID=172907 RepID=A0ABR3N8P9_9TELE